MTELQEQPKTSKSTITVIIVAGVVAIFCILACTAVLITFLMNAPW